jgi:hypothetical protein
MMSKLSIPASVVWDLLALTGVAGIGGLGWIYRPLWLLWIGGVLLALGLVGAKLWAPEKTSER